MSERGFASAGMLGGHSPLDGTVEFYGRLHAFLKPHFTVVDLGAGRGAWHDNGTPYHRSLRMLKGKVSRVIGVDVDRAVMANPSTDENLVSDGRTLPLPDSSADVVVADFVLEHVDDPAAFESEVFRVLKPGGLFCARTPHAFNYVTLAATLARGRGGAKLLRAAQPARDARDVFETKYRCNTMRAFRRYWSPNRWTTYSYLYTAEPSYDFGSRLVYRVLELGHKLLPLPVVGNLFIYEVKRDPSCTS